jgi:hypothetical protein
MKLFAPTGYSKWLKRLAQLGTHAIRLQKPVEIDSHPFNPLMAVIQRFLRHISTFVKYRA